jgi:hypothetical protein
MKRNLMIVAAIAVAIVVVAAGTLIMTDRGGDNNAAGGGPGNWQVGDYWEFNYTHNSTGKWAGSSSFELEKYEVIHVNATNVTLRKTISSPGYPPYLSDLQLGLDFDWYSLKVVSYYSGVNDLTRVGNETISTPWGERTVEHCRGNLGEPTEILYRQFDAWFIKGFLYKSVELMNYDDQYNQIIDICTMQNSNLPQFVIA